MHLHLFLQYKDSQKVYNRQMIDEINVVTCRKSPKIYPLLSLPQISLIYADKQQNLKTTLIPTCLSLRDNTTCCIPLRNLRYLRENIHARVLKQSAQTKPQCLPQISQIYADKPQNDKTALTSNYLSFSAK